MEAPFLGLKRWSGAEVSIHNALECLRDGEYVATSAPDQLIQILFTTVLLEGKAKNGLAVCLNRRISAASRTQQAHPRVLTVYSLAKSIPPA